MTTLNESQQGAINILEVTLCGLSVAGSIAIVIKLSCLSGRRTFCEACLLFMSLGDIVVSFWLGFRAVLLLSGATELALAVCATQGFFVVSTYNAINFWTTVYSIHIFNVLVYGYSRWTLGGPDFVEGMSHLNLLHLIIWTTSLVFGLLAVFEAGIEDGGLDCFISANPPSFRQLLFYIPVYVTMVLVVTLYWRMIVFLRASSSKTEHRRHLREEGNELLWKIGLYPVAYFFIWIPAVVHRLYEAIGDTSRDTEFILTLLQAISWSSQGFINFIVYGLVSRRLGLCCNLDTQETPTSKPAAEPTYGEYDQDADPPEVSVRASVNILSSPFFDSLRD